MPQQPKPKQQTMALNNVNVCNEGITRGGDEENTGKKRVGRYSFAAVFKDALFHYIFNR